MHIDVGTIKMIGVYSYVHVCQDTFWKKKGPLENIFLLLTWPKLTPRILN